MYYSKKCEKLFLALFSKNNYTIFGIQKYIMIKSRLILVTGMLFFLLLNIGFSQTDENLNNNQQAVQSSKSNEPKYSTPPKNKRSIKERFYVGGYLGLQFGTYTSIDISPLLGYRITPDFNVGIGLLYTYTSFDYGPPVGQHGYSSWGGRLSTNYTLFNLISLGVEYQYRTVELYNSFENSFQNQGVNVLFLGGGFRQKVGRNTFMFIMAYYDILQEQYTPYPNVVFRIGVSAGF
jgi:hypothetical protein